MKQIMKSITDMQRLVINEQIDSLIENFFTDTIDYVRIAVPDRFKSVAIPKAQKDRFYKKVINPLMENRFAKFTIDGEGTIRLSFYPHREKFSLQTISFVQDTRNEGIYHTPVPPETDYGTGHGYSYFCRLENNRLRIYKVLFAGSA